METFIIYLLKVSISIALFYGLHMLLLRKETFMKLRRGYFVLALFFSLLYPFISFDFGAVEREQLPLPAYWMSEMVILVDGQTAGTSLAEWSRSLTSSQILFGAMMLGSIILLVRFVIQLSSLFYRLRRSDYQFEDGYQLTYVDDDSIGSFSFFNWIVINRKNKSASQIGDIICHEKAHSKQHHSVDVMFYQVFCILFWWNPFAWLLQKEMKLNLEYLADSEVQKHEPDLQAYQYTLLQISIANTGVAFINNFNVSQLKKRIIMMNKKRTSALWSGKFLLVLPLAMALVLGNVQCSSEENDKGDSTLRVTQNADGTFDTSWEKQNTVETEPKEVYTIVEQMPKFPGGEQAMMRFIGENLAYPEAAQAAGIQGRVTVRFVVQTDGAVTDVALLRGISPECDAEAMRVIEMMPKWEPGKQGGKVVPVYFTLPILFRLK